ncbi:MAG: methylmalonyl-CoA mutase family protein [Cyclobacteriaceae bacterium]
MAQSQFDTFNKADLKTWTEAAKKELGGKDPFDALGLSKHDLIIKPYYDKEDARDLTVNNLKPSLNPYLGPRGWYNSPNINVVNSELANKLALEYLSSGADGIQFTLETEADLDKLLEKIELPYCSIFFVVKNEQSKILSDFAQYIKTKGFDKAQIIGGIYWQASAKPKLSSADLQGWDNFHALGLSIPPSENPINEIVNALLAGVKIIAADEPNSSQLIQHLSFSYAIGTDFFIEIAKLKAFRRLWQQVCYAYGATDKNNSMLLHGISNPWNNEDFQPNANMLKSTTAALSAILGGCEAITVIPEEDNSFKNRIARNVLTVLREESHLNQTADAIAGSYYLENLIDQMAKTAWEKFQQKVNA